MSRISMGHVRRLLATPLIAMTLVVLLGHSPGVAQSGKYKESPLLAEQVKAGKLPPWTPGCRSSRWSCR